MCTAATPKTRVFYMGRTLDYEFSYGEEVTVIPRNFVFNFKSEKCESHYAIIGMAHIANGFPLFYDAANEKGLCMAGLNFVGNAEYAEPINGTINVAQYEFIPFVLSRCQNVTEAKELLQKINLTKEPFSEKLPTAQLHWMIADKNHAIVVEYTHSGLGIYDDPAGVLTNNPPFPEQLFGLNNFMSLSPNEPENRFSEHLPLKRYSRGMGAIGLPGDLSSSSRFVRAAFTRANSVSGQGEKESVGQFFHILGTVEQVNGCCRLENGKCEMTIYTSCINAQKGIYYFTTYENRSIRAVDMHRENLDKSELSRFPINGEQQITFCN